MALVVFFSATYAAVLIWLTVRIVNRREQWAKWTAGILIITLAYPLSQGPYWFLLVVTGKPEWMQAAEYYVYFPVWQIINDSHDVHPNLYEFWRRYINWWLYLASLV